MPTRRPRKVDHLIYADVVDSKAKSGLWFSEKKSFRSRQRQIMECTKNQIDWITLRGAILAISRKPHGIVVIAPNPSLPGIVVLADGTTKANTEKLQRKYAAIVEKCAKQSGVLVQKGRKKK